MNPSSRLAGVLLTAALLSAPVSSNAAAPAAGAALPPALQALEGQGVHVLGAFPSRTGLTAYAARAGGRVVALYLTPAGAVIAGTALGRDGQALDQTALEAAGRPALGPAAWKSLGDTHWIADGRADAPRVVYVFTDPNCPFCAKLWADARPWVDAGKVQLREVLVGVLTPTSRGRAAALLAAKDPAAAFAAYEGAHAPAIARALAAGEHPRPVGAGGLAPLDPVPAALAAELDAHERLMATLGLEATPGVVWRDAGGAVHARAGVEPGALAEILGPR